VGGAGPGKWSESRMCRLPSADCVGAMTDQLEYVILYELTYVESRGTTADAN